MVVVDPKKTVRLTAEPIEHEPSTKELAEYFRSELKKRNHVENLELWQKENVEGQANTILMNSVL